MADRNEYLRKLRTTYGKAGKDLQRLLSWGNLSATTMYQKKVLLGQVNEILKQLGVNMQDTMSGAAPVALIEGAEGARTSAGIGAKVTRDSFLSIDEEAVKYAVAAATDDTVLALSQASKNAARLLDSKYLAGRQNREINRMVANGLITDGSPRELKKKLVGTFSAEWVETFARAKDGQFMKIGGRWWSLEDYAFLTAHTRLQEASNGGSLNWSLKHGFEFMKMSQHPGACELCQKYQGRIYHLGAGKKDHLGIHRDPISDVPNNGLALHPHCRHVLNPWGKINLEVAEKYGSPKTIVQAEKEVKKQEGQVITTKNVVGATAALSALNADPSGLANLYSHAVAGKHISGKSSVTVLDITDDARKMLEKETSLALAGKLRHTADSSFAAHVFKKHGNNTAEAKRGQIGITSNEFKLLPLIVHEPDNVSISKSKSKSGLIVIEYTKIINGRRYEYREEVRKNSLAGLAFYIGKK